MTWRRGWISLFLFTLAMINYIDRVALSVAAKPIAEEFGLSPVAMGYLFSSFLWTYLVCLIPMGILVDRWGTKAVNAGGIALWSLATMATGAAWNFVALVATRLTMGVGEATTFPAGGRVVREWIPMSERGVTNAIFIAGTQAGPALGAVIVAWIISQIGWRGSFCRGRCRRLRVAGGVAALVRSPRARTLAGSGGARQDPERTWRRDAGAGASGERGAGIRSSAYAHHVGPGIGGGLRRLHSVSISDLAAELPADNPPDQHPQDRPVHGRTVCRAALLGILLGRLSDRILTRDALGQGRRRSMGVVMMLSSAVILFAPFVDSIGVLLLLFTLSLTGIATAIALNFSLVNDLLHSPEDSGKAMAILVVGGNAFGIAAPIVTGYVIQITGSYNWAFGIAGLLLVAGATILLTMTRRPIAI